jgi:hypothetical protein
LIPITSTPALSKVKAADEITLFAAGAGPPANKTATRLIAVMELHSWWIKKGQKIQ